jgi:hypothetical protein
MLIQRLTLLAVLLSMGCSQSDRDEDRGLSDDDVFAEEGQARVERGQARTARDDRQVPPEPVGMGDDGDDEPFQGEEGVEVLARGPIHEAFAAPVVFDPEPGLVVSVEPAAPIEEMAPDEKPEGDDIDWIGGYWSWDDDSKGFIWISGIWRNIPPGRQWVPGYWRPVDDGHQWVSGFWTAAAAQETSVTYLPPPPANLDVGPSSKPPTAEHVYAPGSWVWYEEHYVWRPGYWVVQPTDWVWVPARYVWTPGGCVFLDGYWDYAPQYRGLLFAPVRFESVVYARPAYVYRPRAVIDINIAFGHVFARPHYRHYYFGDYYERTYLSVGIFPSFSFHYSRYGYDPIYAHSVVVHRHTPYWERDVRRVYLDRVERVTLRPQRTYVRGGTSVSVNVSVSKENRLVRPLTTAVRTKAYGWNYERVDSTRRTQITARSRETRDYSARRREIEVSGLKERSVRQPVQTSARRVELPASPVRDRVSRSAVRDDDRGGRVVQRGDDRGRTAPAQAKDTRGRTQQQETGRSGRVVERSGAEDRAGRASGGDDNRGRVVQRGDDRGRTAPAAQAKDTRGRTQQQETGRSGRVVERSGAEDRAAGSTGRSRFGAPPRNPTPPAPDAKARPRSDTKDARPDPRRVIERRPASSERAPRRDRP